MNDNHSTSSVSELELLESGNVLIDESELKINNQKVTRRQLPAMDKSGFDKAESRKLDGSGSFKGRVSK